MLVVEWVLFICIKSLYGPLVTALCLSNAVSLDGRGGKWCSKMIVMVWGCFCTHCDHGNLRSYGFIP